MKLSVLLLVLLSAACGIVVAQPYGNEWIAYGQTYYKFPIAKKGVYRIDRNALVNSGIPLTVIDPRNFQLLSRGAEIAIHVEGESDGNFDPGDFIEFYAEGNDGFADAEFYSNPAEQAHPAYSLINDTVYYFLTWNNSTGNRRLIPENDVNYASYTALTYVWRENTVNYNLSYYFGKTYLSGGTDPAYEATEGWFDASFGLGGLRNKNVSTSRVFTSGPAANIEWKLIGESDYAPLSPDHHLKALFAGITFDTTYNGYEVIEKRFSVPASSLSASNTLFSFSSVNDLGSLADLSALAYIRVKYPHQLNFNNAIDFTFFLPDQPGQSKAYIPFTGLLALGKVWVYDLTNNKRVVVTTAGSNHQVLVPNSSSEKKCYVFSEPNIVNIAALQPAGVNGSFTEYKDLWRDSAFIIITHQKLMSEAAQYGAYRTIKGTSSLVVDVSELYEQYAFGINKHPLAIRHFLDHISDTWPSKPFYLFLLGKSVKAHLHRQNAANYGINLVPTMGNPASDIMLSAGLNNTFLEPLLMTGRLSAQSPADVSDYLQKVMEQESKTAAPWMKNILHFAGGTSGTESNRFLSYLNSFADILRDTSFGGNVYTFQKSSTQPIQISLSDSITGLINSGASILTFFGHASTTGGFDQNIDEPSTYSNKGKYPLLVGNSCFTGDIHEPIGQSTSEQFVLIRDRGMIAFLASVDLGFENKLRDYSREFFRSLGQVNYGGPLGEHMKYAIEKIQAGGDSYEVRSITFLMTLHGDPAVVINAHPLPDFEINTSSVSTDPYPLTTQADSFKLDIRISNFGRAINDSLRIEVIRIFPDLTTTFYTISSPPVKYEGTVSLKMPVDPLKGSGFNRVDISLDPSNLIPELSESNNFVSVNFFIKSGDIIPVFPVEFAIVPEQAPELKASTGFVFEGPQQYEFQLDTNDQFAFPLESTTMTGKGGVFEWRPLSLSSMKDSAVYFWRARNADGASTSIWRTGSFQYIPDKKGWSQDHFHQFKRDELLFMEQKEAGRKFDFLSSVRKLTCQTSSTLNFSDLGDILYKIDADLQEYGGCGLDTAIHIAVLDSLTFKPWGTPYMGQNPTHYFGQLNYDGNCGKPRVQNFFIFRSTNVSQLTGLKDMLVNKIPNGNYILAWTWLQNDFSKWDQIDPGLRQTFANLGADSILNISNDTVPYIFFVKKGFPNTAIEKIGTKRNSFIYLTANLMNNASYGSITSTVVGPASLWDSLHWRSYSISDPQTDSVVLTYSGMADRASVPVQLDRLEDVMRKIDLKPMVNVSAYPYLQLEAFISDKTLQTAAQLDRWMIFYEGVMDLAINSRIDYYFYNDTLQEGDKLKFHVAVQNISDFDADSVLIHFYVIDRNRKRIDIPYKRQRPLPADSTLISTIEFSTRGMTGINTFCMEVNPDSDQVEQYHFNNIGQIPFFVTADKVNPILDVTFDGIHILDGDIVSAKPEIAMQLTDENPYLVLDDTSDFTIHMTDVFGNEHRLYFTNTSSLYEMQFIPAKEGSNKAKVVLRPQLLADGSYALRVRASDRSKNESGDLEYKITFNVINRSTITNLLNYPNPFSTSTRFVFVLTGSQIPENIQIQIITISGKIVRSIDMEELGPIHIGRNISDFAWDGTDQFGDKLANGVYLYRVNTRLNGGGIEHRSTEADYYFKKGFGKMVILR